MNYNDSDIDHKYDYLWKKYRPALLSLMVQSKEEPQKYKFLSHEFKDANPKKTGSYSFQLRLFKGKAINDIKTSTVARDLLMVLQKSEKAKELSYESIYEFSMDRSFVLHVKHENAPEEVVLEEEVVVEQG